MRLLPIILILFGIAVTGCNNKDKNTNEEPTKAPISNNINGVFDGYRYNTETYDLNNNGIKGTENIRENEIKNSIKS